MNGDHDRKHPMQTCPAGEDIPSHICISSLSLERAFVEALLGPWWRLSEDKIADFVRFPGGI